MSVFDGILGTIFGGTDTSAQDFQQAANIKAAEAIDTSTKQAKADVLSLFPQADVNRNLGFQAALDVLGQTIPGQLQAFQAGNIGAQQNLLAGLPQSRAAILGGQFDPTAFQTTEINYDPSFAQQTLPTFARGATPMTGEQRQAQATQVLSQMLSGGGLSGTGFDSGGGGGNQWEGRTIGTGDFLADLSSFIGNVPGVVGAAYDSPAGALLPGGSAFKLAEFVNELFGGEGSKSAATIGTSAEPGISAEAKAIRLRAESAAAQRAAAASRVRVSGVDRDYSGGGIWGGVRGHQGFTSDTSDRGSSGLSGRTSRDRNTAADYTCFHADTLVQMADGSGLRIANIMVGDKVADTEGGINTVEHIDTPPLGSRKLYSINGGDDFVTWDHPFLSPDGWVAISPEDSYREMELGKLEIGTTLLIDGGTVEVTAIEPTEYDAETKLYDLHLDGNHQYFANGFVVHNC